MVNVCKDGDAIININNIITTTTHPFMCGRSGFHDSTTFDISICGKWTHALTWKLIPPFHSHYSNKIERPASQEPNHPSPACLTTEEMWNSNDQVSRNHQILNVYQLVTCQSRLQSTFIAVLLWWWFYRWMVVVLLMLLLNGERWWWRSVNLSSRKSRNTLNSVGLSQHTMAC